MTSPENFGQQFGVDPDYWVRKNLNLPDKGKRLENAKQLIAYNSADDTFSSDEQQRIDQQTQEARRSLAPRENGILSKAATHNADDPNLIENGGDYIRVYRGFESKHPDKLNYQNMGQHWTTEPTSADYFSRGGNSVEANPRQGVIVEGLVHKKHVFTAQHPGFREFRAMNNIGGNPGEREIPLLPGAPISIKGVYRMTHNAETRNYEHYSDSENWGNATKVDHPTDLGYA